VNNLLGIGDQFLMSLKRANDGGQRGTQLAYYTPVHASGTLLSLNYSYTDYELGGAFEALQAEGDSQYINIGLSQPLFRDSVKGISALFNITRQKINDEVGVVSLKNKRDVDSIDIGLLGDWTSKAQDAVYQLGANARFGDVDFQNAVAKTLDATGSKTEGHYAKLNLNATRVQYFDYGLSLNIYADYQLGNQNLDSAEKMTIGGINRWRGFAELPALADSGIMTGVELRKRITANQSLGTLLLVGLTPYVFADFGRGKVNQDPAASDNHVESTHYGLGMDLAFKNNWFLNVTGSHQTRDYEGTGAENETRFWGKLQKDF
jgi:hemolysin activation/secretion protein